ncbi:MAG TPA: hypothetical protein VF571_06710 [Pyrinomonadaceae bacterium]|jgi:hypothetical protein
MENQIHETIEQEARDNSSLQTNRVFTDAYALQVAEQVLTNIERVQLKVPHKSYDAKKISALLGEYKAGQTEETGESLQIEFRVLQELHFWRLTLARRDEAVKTFHLRRFYDENASSVTAQMLAALGCFYRSLMPSFEVRSKYDFVVTQLFSTKLPDKPRYVRIGGEELIEHLQRYNVVWTGIEIDWADKKTRRIREEAIAVFDALRAEVGGYNRLEDLLKSNFFNRVRRHKQYLGETFFAPEVTAASIQCSVAVGNKFSQLVSEENESFRNSLESEHGGIDVLNLVLEENPSHSVDLLKQINPDYRASAEDGDFEYAAVSKTILETQNLPENTDPPESEFKNTEPTGIAGEAKPDFLFQNIDEQTEFEADGSEKSAELLKAEKVSCSDNESSKTLCEKSELGRAGNSNFLRVLSEISKREPAENVLREYLNSSPSPEVASFDFSIYLNDIEETTQSENNLKRRALRLIFVAEDYQRRLQNGSQTAPAAEEIKSLKNEIQTVINDLRETGTSLTGENRQERATALLTAVNNLFQARLRLITAFTEIPASQNKTNKQDDSGASTVNKNQNLIETIEKPKNLETKQDKSPNVNGGLVVLTILIVLFGVGYYFFPFASESVEGQKVETSGVRDVNIKSLRGGEQLLVARISNNTLIGVVSDAWQNELIENKRAVLQSLLGQGTQYHYKTVLLFNSKGEIIGNATDREIRAK